MVFQELDNIADTLLGSHAIRICNIVGANLTNVSRQRDAFRSLKVAIICFVHEIFATTYHVSA